MKSKVFAMVLGALLVSCTGDGEGPDAGTAPDAGDGSCTEGEVGTDVGDRIPAAPVQYCSGGETDIRAEACGRRLTLLDVGSAALPACVEATARYATDEDFDALQAAGLEIVQVFTSDQSFQPADAAFCMSYRTQFDIDFRFLIDPLFNTDALGAVHPLSFLLDADGRILEKWEGSVPADQVDVISSYLQP